MPPKPNGFGSSVNGGEFLFLALATCYCNDLYREAAKQGVSVQGVEVQVEGDFLSEDGVASNVTYRVKVSSAAPVEVIRALAEQTDRVAEIQNTLRAGVAVVLSGIDVMPVTPSEPHLGSA